MELATASYPSAPSALLAVAGMFLGLAAGVCFLQECYRYLTKSEDRTYHQVLVDFAGTWIEQVFQPGLVNDLQVRGPFQFRKVRPQGVLLPLSKAELVMAIERLAPIWVRRTLEQLRTEIELQAAACSRTDWSPAWDRLVKEMREVDPLDPTHWDAERVSSFLGVNEEGKFRSAEARTLLVALRHRFLPDTIRIETFYQQFQKNLEYARNRRQVRQIFLFSLALTLLLNLPFNDVLANASRPSREESLAFARAKLDAYDALSRSLGATSTSSHPDLDRGQLEREVLELLRPRRPVSGPLARVQARYELPGRAGPLALLTYLLNCLASAVFVSFGAYCLRTLIGPVGRMGIPRSIRALEPPAPEPGGSGEE